jgi:hypothetical protein
MPAAAPSRARSVRVAASQSGARRARRRVLRHNWDLQSPQAAVELQWACLAGAGRWPAAPGRDAGAAPRRGPRPTADGAIPAASSPRPAGANLAAKIAAGIAAGSLLAGPAFAGVVLEQPQLKKVRRSAARIGDGGAPRPEIARAEIRGRSRTGAARRGGQRRCRRCSCARGAAGGSGRRARDGAWRVMRHLLWRLPVSTARLAHAARPPPPRPATPLNTRCSRATALPLRRRRQPSPRPRRSSRWRRPAAAASRPRPWRSPVSSCGAGPGATGARPRAARPACSAVPRMQRGARGMRPYARVHDCPPWRPPGAQPACAHAPCPPHAAALVVVGGGAFALSSLDAGFADFMRTAAVKVRARLHAAA